MANTFGARIIAGARTGTSAMCRPQLPYPTGRGQTISADPDLHRGGRESMQHRYGLPEHRRIHIANRALAAGNGGIILRRAITEMVNDASNQRSRNDHGAPRAEPFHTAIISSGYRDKCHSTDRDHVCRSHFRCDATSSIHFQPEDDVDTKVRLDSAMGPAAHSYGREHHPSGAARRKAQRVLADALAGQ